jgi:pyrroloquinoline quinone biosynthesis protein E
MTGDAANADPVCDLSPHHHLVIEAVDRANRAEPAGPSTVVEKPLVFRDRKTSRALTG